MKRAKIIIPMGVAGAGKSVQGKLLADDLGYQWISTGEILRGQATEEQRGEMLAGKLLGDDEIIQLVGSFLTTLKEDLHCILDGFPRTLPQAKWLYELHEAGKVEIEAIVHLDVSKEVVLERLLARGRADDKEDVIVRRYNDYLATTEPIIDWLKLNKIPVFEVDGEREISAIHGDIVKLLEGDK